MRKINRIVVHCSATPPDMDIGVDEIREWHLARGWSDVGYHAVIRQNGRLEKGRNIGTPGAHARGYNKNSIGICLIGGVDCGGNPQKNYTDGQIRALRNLINLLLILFPDAELCGHNDLTSKKACPCFDVKDWYYG